MKNYRTTKLLFLLLAALFFISACTESTQTASEGSAPLSVADNEMDISREAFKSMPADDRILIDVRTTEEYGQGYISDAVNIPVAELSEQMDKIIDLAENKDAQIVVYCRSGKRAGKAIDYLASQGFTNLKHLDGDFGGWEAANEAIMKP